MNGNKPVSPKGKLLDVTVSVSQVTGAITNNIPGKLGVGKVGRFERNFAAKQGAPNLIVNGTFGHLFTQQNTTS